MYKLSLSATPQTSPYIKIPFQWDGVQVRVFIVTQASLVAQLVNKLPAIQETSVQFLGWEDPLEKEQTTHSSILGFPDGSDSKESACHAGDLGSNTGLGRFPGEGNDYPLQYSGLENSVDRRTWQATFMGSQRGGVRDRDE